MYDPYNLRTRKSSRDIEKGKKAKKTGMLVSSLIVGDSLAR